MNRFLKKAWVMQVCWEAPVVPPQGFNPFCPNARTTLKKIFFNKWDGGKMVGFIIENHLLSSGNLAITTGTLAKRGAVLMVNVFIWQYSTAVCQDFLSALLMDHSEKSGL